MGEDADVETFLRDLLANASIQVDMKYGDATRVIVRDQ